MDRATSQIGRTASGRCCVTTKKMTKKNKNGTPGFNSELCGMDKIYGKASFIFWPPIPHMPHEV